jgi:hypothetical protein
VVLCALCNVTLCSDLARLGFGRCLLLLGKGFCRSLAAALESAHIESNGEDSMSDFSTGFLT